MTCTLENNKFAVSVARALLFDTTCAGKQLILNAKTLMNSSISQAVQSSQIYGGNGSRLLMEYDYQKQISVTLEDSVFSPVYLATQNGGKFKEVLGDVYRNEQVKFDSTGEATLKGIANGNVQVGLEDGTYMTVLATGNKVTVPQLADKDTTVVYTEQLTTKTLTIDSTTFPKSLELVLSIDIFDSNSVKVEELQIIIPNFKPDGNFELSLTHDGVATSSMTGKALDSCGKYADIKIIPVEGTINTCTVTDLLVTPNPINLDSTDLTETVQLVVRPVFSDGSTGAPLAQNAATYTVVDTTIATVSATGLVTPDAGATQGENTTVTIEYAVGGVSATVPLAVL